MASPLAGHKIGFIGCGMMATAMIRGLINVGFPPSDIIGCDLTLVTHLPEGVRTTKSVSQVVTESTIVVIAVKPYGVDPVLSEVAQAILLKQVEPRLIVSIAAGVTIAAMEEALAPAGSQARVVRCMPNTPCLVGQAAVGFALGTATVDGDAQLTQNLFEGTVLEVAEKDLDAVTALSGSGPAYVFLFIEALADAGVRAGLTRPVALQLAAQTVKGSACMVLETSQHPGALKDQVCSPGGTTIAGVEALEKNGFRYAAMSAVGAAAQRCKELGK